jgi:hypothetical protein
MSNNKLIKIEGVIMIILMDNNDNDININND